MKTLTNIGRIVYAIPFLIFGLFHFLSANQMASSILNGWPANLFIVYLTGAALILAGISILINKVARTASLLLALFLLLTIALVHLPGLANEETMRMAMSNALKDMGLMGAAIAFAGILKS
jgi:putative oxidoreductase